MNLSRTRNGTMIHHRDCPQIIRYTMFQTHAVPWLWADDKTELEVAGAIIHFDYRICKHCKPIRLDDALWDAMGFPRFAFVRVSP